MEKDVVHALTVLWERAAPATQVNTSLTQQGSVQVQASTAGCPHADLSCTITSSALASSSCVFPISPLPLS